MIRQAGDSYVLMTPSTCYALRVTETGHLEHLYYGPGLGWTWETPEAVLAADCAALAERREFAAGNTVWLDPAHKAVTLEDLRLEFSARGKGDLREPFVEITFQDGSKTPDFRFQEATISPGKAPLPELPSSYGLESQVDTLEILLLDEASGLKLTLQYWAWRDVDVICRACALQNGGEAPVTVERLLSTQLDFPDGGYEMTVFHGAWAREMERETLPVGHGAVTASSAAGVSSSRMNPFVMLHRAETSETSGLCYGLNLIYSGNHYESAQMSAFDKTRFLSGVNPEAFSWTLAPGERLQAPEAVMACSDAGFRGMSGQMHAFVREHIVRGWWKKRTRPVLLNSWEAAYFQINRAKFLSLAKRAKEVGAELIVLDDGWFAQRSDDSRSLGDWDMNTKKFPGGIAALSRKVREIGLDFGIWIEPEMVNVDSDLYRAHPDWAMDIPGRAHSEGRNQRVLDLANPEVVSHLIGRISDLLSSADISYVKWDMNRVFSDVYSRALPPERQGEVCHRYTLGLYRLMAALTEKFPKVLFEGCASGGNRFDLGILCYCPQIWASDNTDAICRAEIQTGYSFGYPMHTVSAHVSSCPNHQTLRQTPLDTRFAVALYGVLGYECNLADMGKDELSAIQTQIALYKQWREVLQFGDFYRLEAGNVYKWICVSRDRKRAVGMMVQRLARPNFQYARFQAAGLDETRRYRFYSLPRRFDIRAFGDLVNTVSPVHVKQGSAMHNAIAKFVTLPGEVEDMIVSGGVLMGPGVPLSPAYGGTGFNENTRYFQDFSARLYFMEAVE